MHKITAPVLADFTIYSGVNSEIFPLTNIFHFNSEICCLTITLILPTYSEHSVIQSYSTCECSLIYAFHGSTGVNYND